MPRDYIRSSKNDGSEKDKTRINRAASDNQNSKHISNSLQSDRPKTSLNKKFSALSRKIQITNKQNFAHNRTHFSLNSHRVLPTFMGQLKLRYAYGLDLSGNTAYVADFVNGVAIVDITTASAPRLLSTYNSLPGYANDVAVLGQLLMVANYQQGFLILDISNSANPILKGSLSFPSYTWAVVAQNNKAYVANYDLGLRIIDVTVSTSPVLKGTYDTPGLAEGVAIQANLCFVADIASGTDPGGVRIYDVTNPSSAILRASYSTNSPVSSVLARSGLLFAVSNSNIDIIDVAIATQPVLKGRYTSSNTLFKADITPSAEYIYATSFFNGMEIVNIQNTTSPIYVGKYEVPSCRGVKIGGNSVLITAEAEGLITLKKQRIIPESLSKYRTSGNVRNIAIKKDGPDVIAYAVDDFAKLNIIDVSNSKSPIFKSSINIPSIVDVTLTKGSDNKGDIVLASAYDHGIILVNVTNPNNPVLVSTLDTIGLSYSSIVKNNLAYVADYGNGLLIVNITNPHNPIIKGHYAGSISAVSVFVTDDNYVILGDGSGMRILSTNIQSPALLSNLPLTQGTFGIASKGNTVYLANYDNGLVQVDISNKVAPIIKSTFNVGGSAFAVKILGSAAYVAAYQAGVQIISTSNAMQPEWIGEYVQSGGIYDLELSGRLAYVAHAVTGVDILDNIVPSIEPIINSNKFLIHRGETRKFNPGYFNATDIDSDVNNLIIRFFNVLRATIASSQKPDTSITQCLQSELPQVQITHDGSALPPAMSITVDDGFGEIPVTPQPTQFIFVTTPPSLNLATFMVHQGELIVITTNNIRATTAGIVDPDLTIYVDQVAAGQFERSTNPNFPIFSFKQKEILDNIIRFRHLNSEAAPTCSLSVGIVNLRSASQSVNINYINRNDPPVLMEYQIDIDEAGERTLSASNFNSMDPDGNEPTQEYTFGNLLHMDFYSKPQARTITKALQSNITLGHIVARHDHTEFTPSGTVTVRDSSGLQDGPKPISITFHNVPTPPQFSACTLQVTQGKKNAVTLVNFDISDSDSSDDNLTIHIINSLRGHFENAFTGEILDHFTKNDIKNGQIIYAADDVATPPSFQAYVVDETGLQSATLNAVITYARVNHPPTIIENSLTIDEGGISTPRLNISDPDTPNNQIQVNLFNIFNGQMEYNANSTVLTFPYSSYLNGLIKFHSQKGALKPGYTLQATDGQAVSQQSDANVLFTPVNAEPIVVLNQVTVTSGIRKILGPGDQLATDDKTSAGDILFRIGQDARNVRFEYCAAPGQSIFVYPQSKITTREVCLVPTNNFAPAYTITADDGLLQSAVSTAVVSFTAVNLPPTILENSLIISEGAIVRPYLNITDPDNPDTEIQVSLFNVQEGNMEINSTNGITTTVLNFAYSDYKQGLVNFHSKKGGGKPGYSLQASDGHSFTQQSAANVAFTPINASPSIVVNQATVTSGIRTILSPSDQLATDDKTAAGDILFRIGQDARNVRFEYCAAPGQSIFVYPQSKITTREVCLVPTNNAAPVYTLTADDGLLQSAVSTAVVSFTAINLPPTILENSLIISEGAIAKPHLNITDPDTPDTEIQISLFNVQEGNMELSGPTTSVNPVLNFFYSDYKNGLVKFHSRKGGGKPGYSLQASDGNSFTQPSAANVVFTPVNAAPSIIVNQATVTSGIRTILSPSDQLATDDKTPTGDILFRVGQDAQNVRFEYCAAPGQDIFVYPQSKITTREVCLVPTSTAAPSYTLTADDGLLQSDSSTAAVTFTPVNRPPIITENSLKIDEGATANPDLNIVDPDNTDDEIQVSLFNVEEGAMEFSDNAGSKTPVLSFAYSDYKNGLINFHSIKGGGKPGYTIQANDGQADSQRSTATVDFTPINAPPVVVVNQANVISGKRTILGPGDQLATDDKTAAGDILFKIGPDAENVRFEYCAAPDEAISVYPQSKVTSREVCLVPTSNEAPSYSLSVDDGQLASDFSKAVVAFTAQTEIMPADTPITTRIGIGIGGSLASAAIVGGIRYAYNNSLRSSTETILRKRPEEIGEEYKPYYSSLFLPIIRSVFEKVKTFKNLIFLSRSEKSTTDYIEAIEEIVKELTLYPSFLKDAYLKDGPNKTRLIRNINAEIRNRIKKIRCRDSGYITSYFRPEITAARLMEIAPHVARSVITALGLDADKKLNKDPAHPADRKELLDGIEMQPVDTEKTALLPAFRVMSQKVESLEERMQRMERGYTPNSDTAEGSVLLVENSLRIAAEV